MANGDYGYFGKGDTGYAQYMIAYNRNFGDSSGGGGGGNHNNCSKVILNQLGQMYGAGGAFTENINAAGGAGAAEFAQKAIGIYCR